MEVIELLKSNLLTLGLAILLVFQHCDNKRTIRSLKSDIVSELDTRTEQIDQYRDELNRHTTVQLDAITNNRESLEAKLEEINIDLKKIKGKVSGLATISDVKKIQLEVPSVVTVKDTVNPTTIQTVPDSLLSLFDLYTITGRFSDDWVDISSDATIKGTSYDISVRDSLMVIQSVQSKIFKPDKYITTVKSLNPYSQSQSVKTYRYVPRKRKWGLGISSGYAITKDGLRPYIGVGLQYNIIPF